MCLRIRRSVFLAVLVIVEACAASTSSWASSACVGLPPSTLSLYDIRVSAPEVESVPTATLDCIPRGDLGSRHSLMLTGADVVTLFEIRHRTVPQADGSVCDAPRLVRIGLGAGRRVAYLARRAAADECVRKELLAHEEVHNRSFDETIDRFIEQEKTEFQQGMLTLKRIPASNAENAKARFEAALR